MNHLKIFSIFFFMLFCFSMNAQSTTEVIDNYTISSTQAIFHGKSKSIRESVEIAATSKEKKNKSKINNKVPDNFRGRKNKSSAIYLSKEHQGPDPVLQSEINKSNINQFEILVNRTGFGSGSPTDPTGDVSNDHYVQAVNATQVAVFDRQGVLEMSFPMNTLWGDFGFTSAGDPIILFDEITNRWILTEFTFSGNFLLVAISDTNDPLGTYNAFSFATPNFPDYPKYSLSPDALVVTTNEGGPTALHNYFISKEDLFFGEGNARIQRIEIEGPAGSEQSFIVSTPVDWNGTKAPFDNRPIIMRLNDSSWGGGPAQDQVELYTFDVDFDNPSNTVIEQTNIVTTPYDAFPCSVSAPNAFDCIPQMGNRGLDGIPEVIMHVPHQRNFGTHESLVYTHITDATNGNNRAGVRWVELRRDSESDWTVYQEGTFAPDDGLNRFMSSIAIDEKGNICLGYSVSSANSFAGIRATGRNNGDPLGEMTYDETILRTGGSAINSGGRFGDYPQMSVVPGGLSEFWFTTEFASGNGTVTNISALRLTRDSFDLAMRAFLSPDPVSTNLTAQESVTVEIFNSGINAITGFDVALEVDGALISSSSIPGTIESGEIMVHTFPDKVDLTAIQDYDFRAFVTTSVDENPLNDTLATSISVLPDVEAMLSAEIEQAGCSMLITGSALLENIGGEIISTATISLTLNGVAQPNLTYNGSLSTGQARSFIFDLPVDQVGDYEIVLELIEVNGQSSDFDLTNNSVTINTEVVDEDNFILVSLLVDDFPQETSYTVVSQTTGAVFAEEGGFVGDGMRFNNKVCLPLDDCYTFIITDTFGDGICCNFGQGNITIFDNAGNEIVFNGGQFQDELSIDFCAAPGSCSLTADINVRPSSDATSEDGIIMVTAVNGVGPFMYSINGGEDFQDATTFADLLAGEYNVVVTDANSVCVYEETVIVDFNTATHTVGGTIVNVDILPNPTSGVFQVNIQNLPTQEDYLNVSIFDIQGKFIQYKKLGKFDNDFIGSFSLYAYPAGTYLVRIQTAELNILEKIVKQ